MAERTCTIDGCDKPFLARNLCGMHYKRLRNHGTTEPPPQKPPARWIDSQYGYVVISGHKWHPNANPRNGQIFEHRLVMSEMLGRPLGAGENVHHKNGDRADNRPENLELWVVNQPSGQRAEDLVAWAREIIERYA